MMKLPLREFADVVQAMKGPGESGAGSEKRKAARMTGSAKLTAFLIEGGKVGRSYSILTRDISISGVGVLQSITLQPGQEVILALPRTPQPPLFVTCVAMHCRPL